jgi:alanyl-tRNA synthetase
VEDIERRVEEERARIEAEYREVLKSSVAFEKRIRNRWREKNREKNARIARLESRVAQLEKELETLRADLEEDVMADRETKERKLLALMVNDLGIADVEEQEMVKMKDEVRSLSDEELDQMLASRLDLPYPVDAEVLDKALARVEEPERLSQRGSGGFTGAPDMSHEPRPEERRGED